MKIFVISLEHNNEARRKHIKDQFTRRELDFEFLMQLHQIKLKNSPRNLILKSKITL